MSFSSPLSKNLGLPRHEKLITETLRKSNMDAHCRMILSAKPTVNTQTPHAYSASVLVRDRIRRDRLNKQHERRKKWIEEQKSTADIEAFETKTPRPFSSKVSHLADYIQSNNNVLIGDDTFRDDLNEPELMRLAHKDRLQETFQKTKPTVQAQRFVLSSKLGSTGVSTVKQLRTNSSLPTANLLQSADVLDKRSHVFKGGKEFTPRTLRTNAKSALSRSKHYNKPKANGTQRPASSSTHKLKNDRIPTNEQMVLDASLQSRTMARLNRTISPGIPALDISVDTDHMAWLQDQQERTALRADLKLTPEAHPLANLASPKFATASPTKDTGYETIGNDEPQHHESSTMRKIREHEDELLYLEFVGEVTADVLRRQIYTNRVLRRVFDQHVERRRGSLQESKMRDYLETLRDELGIPSDDDNAHNEDDIDLGMRTVKRSTHNNLLSIDETALYERNRQREREAHESHLASLLGGSHYDTRRDAFDAVSTTSYDDELGATYDGMISSEDSPVRRSRHASGNAGAVKLGSIQQKEPTKRSRHNSGGGNATKGSEILSPVRETAREAHSTSSRKSSSVVASAASHAGSQADSVDKLGTLTEVEVTPEMGQGDVRGSVVAEPDGVAVVTAGVKQVSVSALKEDTPDEADSDLPDPVEHGSVNLAKVPLDDNYSDDGFDSENSDF